MPSLQITYDELRRHIGRFLGSGRNLSGDENDWDEVDLQDIEDVLVSGLRSFYYPPFDEDGNRHVWSFLSKAETLSLAAGQNTVDLPSDFSSVSSPFVLADGSGNRPLAPSTEDEIRSLLATEDATGTPLYYAIRPKSADQDAGSRTQYEVMFYPSAAANLFYRYEVEPLTLDDSNVHPLGGAQHSETILEACLAAAEKVIDPEAGEGIHHGHFQRLLKTSIAADQKVNKPTGSGLWPVADGITGSTGDLHVDKDYLMRRIGLSMEYGPNPKAWAHDEAAMVNEILRGGLRRFYSPVVLPQEKYPHQWSFLRPIHRLTLISGQSTYDLPDDFAMLRGPIDYEPGESVFYPSIPIVSDEIVRRKLQLIESAARPEIAAVQVKRSAAGELDETVGTRYQLIFFPNPDESHALLVPYGINPVQLTNDTDLPFGGQPHANTLIEACLAEAEMIHQKSTVHQNEFLRCLIASVGHDRMVQAPDTLGYAGDHSDGLSDNERHQNWHYWDENSVLYEGVKY